MSEPGQLFYLMGASGAGKDSLIQFAKCHRAELRSIKYAKRYITRPADVTSDQNHHAIEPVEFDRLLKNGHFAMHWKRHGFQYGVSKEINLWLEEGKKVIINGSRQYYHKARRDYPKLHAILVQADQEILRKRLLMRRRDAPGNIEKRMRWAEDFIKFEDQDELFTIINNNAALKIAGEKFLAIIQVK